MVAAAVRSPAAAAAPSEVFAGRNRLAGAIVERAAERGEVPPGTGAAAAPPPSAPFYYRLLIQRGPVDDALAETAAAAACAAALSGVFAPLPTSP